MTQTPGAGPAGSRGSSGTDSFLDRLQTIDLRRSDDSWLGGVCAGLAERIGVDPLVIRALFAVLSLGMGLGILLYLAAWLLVPDARGNIHLEGALRRGEGGPITLLVFTVVALLGTLGWFGSGWDGTGSWGNYIVWRLLGLLIVAGGALWLWSEWRSRPDPGYYGRETAAQRPQRAASPSPTGGHAPAGGQAPMGGHAHTGTSAGPGWSSEPSASGVAPERSTRTDTAPVLYSPPGPIEVHSSGGATAWTPTGHDQSPPESAYPGAGHSVSGDAGEPPRGTPDRQVPPPPPGRPPRRSAGAAGTLLAMGLALVAGGGLGWFVTEQGWDINGFLVGLAAALGALGLVILVLGLAGRTSGFVGFLGVCALLGTALVTPVASTFVLSGQLGDRNWTPTEVSEEPFRLGAGSGTLDLGSLDPDDLAGEEIQTSVGFGELVITVPEDLTVHIEGSTGAGVITVHESGRNETSGLNVSEDVTFGDGPVDLTVDARVGFGHLVLEGSNR